MPEKKNKAGKHVGRNVVLVLVAVFFLIGLGGGGVGYAYLVRENQQAAGPATAPEQAPEFLDQVQYNIPDKLTGTRWEFLHMISSGQVYTMNMLVMWGGLPNYPGYLEFKRGKQVAVCLPGSNEPMFISYELHDDGTLDIYGIDQIPLWSADYATYLISIWISSSEELVFYHY